MIEFWLVLISALVGIVFSVANVISAMRDRKALEEVNANEAAKAVGVYMTTTEAVRLVQLTSLALISGAILAATLLPASWERTEGKVIVWMFVVHCWLLTANTALSWSYRKRLRERFLEEPQEEEATA